MKSVTSASPHAIMMVGIPGSGKSTFAEHFADTFKAPIVSQTKLKREFNLSDVAAESLRDFILGEYMKTHRTVLIDGGLDKKDSRDELIKRLKKAGYRFLVVWVQTDTNEALRRAAKPYPKGSGIASEEFDELVAQFDPPHEKERPVVISGKHTYTSQLKIVLKQIASAPTQTATTPKPQTQANIPSSVDARSRMRRSTGR